MPISISHFEIKVRDLPGMEAFYTDTLGFRVTDRSPEDSSRGGHRMVFLSQNPGEHHQIVLNEAKDGDFSQGSLDHLAFRVSDLKALRSFHDAVAAHGGLDYETVSHGTTWSLYFSDPEGNRLEFFVDTPWHVAQPLRFSIDLSMSDEDLIAWTEEKISSLADFQPVAQWSSNHRQRLKQ